MVFYYCFHYDLKSYFVVMRNILFHNRTIRLVSVLSLGNTSDLEIFFIVVQSMLIYSLVISSTGVIKSNIT